MVPLHTIICFVMTLGALAMPAGQGLVMIASWIGIQCAVVWHFEAKREALWDGKRKLGRLGERSAGSRSR